MIGIGGRNNMEMKWAALRERIKGETEKRKHHSFRVYVGGAWADIYPVGDVRNNMSRMTEVLMKIPLTQIPIWPVVFGFIAWVVNPWALVMYVPAYLLGVVWAFWCIARVNQRYVRGVRSDDVVTVAAWSWLARIVIRWRTGL